MFNKLFIILTVCHISISLGIQGIAKAEIPGCKVGDYSQGNWRSLPIPKDCPFKGPHADESPWPTDEPDLTIFPWAISGRYKIIEWTISNGGYYVIPQQPDFNGYPFGCIKDLEEAAAEEYCEKMQSETPLRTRKCVRSSNIVTITDIYHYPEEFIMPNYYRRFDAYVRNFQEWKCNISPGTDPLIKNNFSPPCALGQCCFDME
jgi:hypothetical protein